MFNQSAVSVKFRKFTDFENKVENGETAANQHFLLFPQNYSKGLYTGPFKVMIVC